MKKSALFSLFMLIAGMYHTAFSTHIAGGDLTYRCLGGNYYEITFSFYRDCSGVAEPASVNVAFVCTFDAAFNFNVTMPKIAGTGQEIYPTCAAMPSRCIDTGSAFFGVREYVYRTNVTLPPCNSWRMSYTLCCRNPNNTIVSPTSHNGYFETYLNNLDAPGSSSPVFGNKPVFRICQGQTFCYNHGAVDPNGDSLSYELTPPKSSNTATLPYNTGFSYHQPLVSNPPVSCNAIGGDICMTPSMNIISVMAVLVKKWRTVNGIPRLVGMVTRDLQVIVETCSNTLPTLSGMDTTLVAGYQASNTIYYTEVYAGTPLNFNIWGHDADTFNPSIPGRPDRFSIVWNHGIPSGTFTVFGNGTNSAYANFQWIPGNQNAGSSPHCFTATITDEACPHNGVQAFSYCIRVHQYYAGIDNNQEIRPEVFPNPAGNQITFKLPETKTYVIEVSDLTSACKGKYPTSTAETSIDLEHLSPGLYFYTIRETNGEIAYKGKFLIVR